MTTSLTTVDRPAFLSAAAVATVAAFDGQVAIVAVRHGAVKRFQAA